MSEPKPSPREVLLSKAIVGAKAYQDLASEPIRWAWEPLVEEGATCMVSGGPGGGKTTLVLSLLCLRARTPPTAVSELLGYPVAPARGSVVLVEAENSRKSTARKLERARTIAGLPSTIYDRLWTLPGLRVGDADWRHLAALVENGDVSDICLDTLASTSSHEANDEQAQITLFKHFKELHTKSPYPLNLWLVAHTRKAGKDAGPTGTVDDVGGSQQRAAQCDTVLMVTGNRDDAGNILSSTLTYPKRREDGDVLLKAVKYQITKTEIKIMGVGKNPAPVKSLADRVKDYLRNRPEEAHTESSLADAMGASRGSIKSVIEKLLTQKSIREGLETRRGVPTKTFTIESCPGGVRVGLSGPDKGQKGLTLVKGGVDKNQ